MASIVRSLILALVSIAVIACSDSSGSSTTSRGGGSSDSSRAMLGTFTGSDGLTNMRLVVREESISFSTTVDYESVNCRGSIPEGVRRNMRVQLDCGSDLAIAGVQLGIQLESVSDGWSVYGTGAFSGMSGTLRR